MGIRSFIRGIREEIFPETLVSKLEELEELDKKIMNLKVSKDTVVFKKSAENDFLKAVLHFCEDRDARETNKE